MQQRQSAESPTHNLATNERARTRKRSVPLLLTGAAAAILALFTVGCPQPADLDNAESYPADPGFTKGGGSSGGATGGSMSGPSCVTSCFTTVMKGCTGCHGKVLKSAGLDLENAGVANRLKDQPATHAEVADKSGCPTGDKLIDSGNAMESWLLKKVNGQHSSCGFAMPVGPALNAADLECMKTYVTCVAATAGTGTPSGGAATGGGGSSAAGAATGGAGAATGGGGAATGGGGSGGTGGA